MTTDQNRSAMLSDPGPITGWIWRRLFSRIPVDEAAIEHARAQARAGQLVYVMRVRSLLDYLFFNFLFLKANLPLARFGNGVDPSLFRGLGTWLREVWSRIARSGADRPLARDRLTRVVEAGDSAPHLHEAPAVHRRAAGGSGLHRGPPAVQRQQARPLLLMPQLITWQREPPSKQPRFLDAVFGNQDTPSRLRKLIFWVRHRKQATVRLGEPINLQTVIADHEGWSDERIARKVRRVLFIHLAREAMSVRGPAVKAPDEIKREVMERQIFQKELEVLGQRLNLSPGEARTRARRYLDEIAATTTFELLHVFGWVLDRVFNRAFRGVEVDAEGMRRVREAARLSRRAPLILVPSHKSHMDYLVISWVFMRNEFIPPHIAAGDNLSFFPLGGLLRRAGAFFLRRSFKGLPIYTLVFRRYLWKLVREGYPIEFFMEGGRSRTGKLLPPKLGKLNMLVEGARRGEYKDLQFVPINLSYERVLETDAYRRELTGEEKKAESVGG
ncbi:MAG: 1-acyl-sn-glycerol-3-phosphate acyltransferase, partial [bacterium]